MLEVLNKELKITVLSLENQPDTYYLSYMSDTKCVIDTVMVEGNILIIPDPKEDCTVEELNTIISCFSNYIFKIKPEIKGILFKTDPQPSLEEIGFTLLSEDSEYLYKENKRINKVR